MPAFFAGELWGGQAFYKLSVGFLVFSLAASCIYCINDIADLEFDREHPIKKNRPFASGRIKIAHLSAVAAGLLLAAALLSLLLPMAARWILALYVLSQVAYSFLLKHIAVIDCVLIALGFVFRILFGGLILGFTGSSWIILVTFLLSLYLAFAKRRSELAMMNGTHTRRSLENYSLQFLDISLATTCAVTMVAYIMYTHDAEVVARVHYPYFYLSSGFVIVGLLRHLQQTIQKNETESPSDYLFRDPVIIASVLAWIVFNSYVLYTRH